MQMEPIIHDQTNAGSVLAAFASFLRENTDPIFSQPFFAELTHGLSAKAWGVYAKQFHVTCISFDKLLDAAKASVQKTGNAALIAELEANYADEKGYDAPEAIAHSILRANFFEAIGLPRADMTTQSSLDFPVLPGTHAHKAVVEKMIRDGDIYELIGAFVAQEYLACDKGFEMLTQGVTASFPALADRNHESMRYVYGHIDSDAQEHFPQLLEAVVPLMADTNSRNKIYAGARAMLRAEKELYVSFEKDILSSCSLRSSEQQQANIVSGRADGRLWADSLGEPSDRERGL